MTTPLTLDASHFDFSGKRVLVTGAAGGIGGAMARAFAAHGASLLLADRCAEGLATLRGELSGSGSRVDAVRTYDQSRVDSVHDLADAAGQVDVLMNNAGILAVGPVIEMEPGTIVDIINTNLLGPILLARAVGTSMAKHGGGVIVNTSSQLAFCGAATRAVYAATKAAIRHFTMSFGAEMAPLGVRVTAIAPGRTLTPMNAALLSDPRVRADALTHIPGGRLGEAAEIARLALFLASPPADYVIGETLVADGGYVTV